MPQVAIRFLDDAARESWRRNLPSRPLFVRRGFEVIDPGPLGAPRKDSIEGSFRGTRAVEVCCGLLSWQSWKEPPASNAP